VINYFLVSYCVWLQTGMDEKMNHRLTDLRAGWPEFK